MSPNIQLAFVKNKYQLNVTIRKNNTRSRPDNQLNVLSTGVTRQPDDIEPCRPPGQVYGTPVTRIVPQVCYHLSAEVGDRDPNRLKWYMVT